MNGSEPLIDRDDDENSEIIARQDDVELSGICGMTLRRPSTSPFSVHLRGMRTPPRENHAELLELHRNLIFDGTTFQADGESEQICSPENLKSHELKCMLDCILMMRSALFIPFRTRRAFLFLKNMVAIVIEVKNEC